MVFQIGPHMLNFKQTFSPVCAFCLMWPDFDRLCFAYQHFRTFWCRNRLMTQSKGWTASCQFDYLHFVENYPMHIFSFSGLKNCGFGGAHIEENQSQNEWPWTTFSHSDVFITFWTVVETVPGKHVLASFCFVSVVLLSLTSHQRTKEKKLTVTHSHHLAVNTDTFSQLSETRQNLAIEVS